MCTEPPCSPLPMPLASSVPATSTCVPASPSSTMRPASWPTLRARTVPPRLIAPSTTAAAVRALICTLPPSADSTPLLITRATCEAGTTHSTSRSPYGSIVNAVPLASATVPRRAVIVPRFATDGAISAARPPSRTVIWPSLAIAASGRPADEKRSRPAMRSSLRRFAVLATSPATSTRESRPNTMPYGLTRKTWPFACSRPRICDASLPTTRLRTTACADGCWNTTDSPVPMLKLCQSMAALLLVWRTCSAAPAGAPMLAWPATTLPPVGSAPAAHGDVAS